MSEESTRLQGSAPPTASPRFAELRRLLRDVGANPALDAALVALCAERDALAANVKRLEAIIERERSAASRWIERIRAEIRRRRGIAESRGSYEWDDDGYRKEFSAALEALDKALDKAEKETNYRDLSDSPKTQAEVDAARQSVPDATRRETPSEAVAELNEKSTLPKTGDVALDNLLVSLRATHSRLTRTYLINKYVRGRTVGSGQPHREEGTR